MNQERGRVYKDKLDQISNEYASLHSIFKKLIKSEEESLENRREFQEKWSQVASMESYKELSDAFANYSTCLKITEEAHLESLNKLKEYVQEALRISSLKIKQQKRSLSRGGSKERTIQERSKSQSRNERGAAEEMRRVATQEDEESERELKLLNEETQKSIREFENKHVNDIKQVLLHLMNAEMFHHAVALQQLTNLAPLVQSIDPDQIPAGN